MEEKCELCGSLDIELLKGYEIKLKQCKKCLTIWAEKPKEKNK